MRWREGSGSPPGTVAIDLTYTLRVIECLLRSESRPDERNNLLRLLEGWQADDNITDWSQRRARSLVRTFGH